MHTEDVKIKRRVREAHAAAGSPPYETIVAGIAKTHPELGISKANVDHWFAQGQGSVVIPARALPALAAAFDTTVQRLLGVEETVDREIIDRVQAIEAKLTAQGETHEALMKRMREENENDFAREVLHAAATTGQLSDDQVTALRNAARRVLGEDYDSFTDTGNAVSPAADTGKFVARAPKAGKASSVRPRVDG